MYLTFGIAASVVVAILFLLATAMTDLRTVMIQSVLLSQFQSCFFLISFISVTTFEDRSGFHGHWDLGPGLADLLVSELVKSKNFVVLERGHLEFAIWQYTLSGHGALESEGKSYLLNPGDAMLIYIPQDHCYYLPESSRKWEFIYLNLHGSEVMRIWKELTKKVGAVAHLDAESSPVSLALSCAHPSALSAVSS